jgi:hypothetical protein
MTISAVGIFPATFLIDGYKLLVKQYANAFSVELTGYGEDKLGFIVGSIMSGTPFREQTIDRIFHKTGYGDGEYFYGIANEDHQKTPEYARFKKWWKKLNGAEPIEVWAANSNWGKTDDYEFIPHQTLLRMVQFIEQLGSDAEVDLTGISVEDQRVE